MDMGSNVKKTLELVCCDNGWSYGVFWRFNSNNSMLLTLEDAYYEQHMGTMLVNMLLQVHMLGEGIIGQAAFTGKHRWLFSDGELNSIDSFGIHDIFQGDSEIHHHFSYGIKTIAVISVESQGVVLFGSTHKILESVEFLDRVKNSFREMGNIESHLQLDETNLKSMHGDIYDDLGIVQNSVENEFMLADTIHDLSNCYTVDNLSELLAESDGLFNIPVTSSTNVTQSSISNTLGCVEEHDLFNGLGLDCEFTLPGECWEDIVPPVVSNSNSTISTGVSAPGPRKGLFSELGLEELLNGIGSTSSSVTKLSFQEQISSCKRKRVNGTSVDSDQVHLGSVSCSSKSMSNVAQPKKPEEPAKGARKRARPGESTRPRPKDRQQIQDRLTELRKLVPNGNKPPIDVLPDRTIKYMIFLQSVTQYADKLKQADEPKMIDHGNGVVLKDNKGGNGGVTWAFEVGGQTLVCPIVVEDLNPPGQMLIEMLCEDQGFFLEIADVIRGFGLNILKGVMELRENKIWARFIVEANRNVTRTDIFWSLIQLLQQTGTSGIESSNLQQRQVLLPISMAETLH